MNILDVLDIESIIENLSAKNKQGILEELVKPHVKATGIENKKLVQVLVERERLGSTGIGSGVGIPHGKLEGLQTIRLGFGISRDGVDFESIDGKPTHLFFLLLTPENSAGLHLKMLARISRLLKKDTFKEKLLQSSGADEIYKIIRDEDEDF